VTLPDLSPEEPGTGQRDRLLQGGLIVLTVALAGLLGVTSLVEALREGTVDLATVFYPVLLGALAALAWTRRTGA